MEMIDRLLGHRVYLGTNVFIYALYGFPLFTAVSTAILKAVEEARLTAVTSELALAEALVRPLRNGQQQIALAYQELLQSRPTFEVAPVSRSILISGAEIRATTGGRMPDAIHAATAAERNCAFFVTADKSIKAAGSIQVIVLETLLAEGS